MALVSRCEQRALQRVDERSYSELGHQPHEVWRKAAVNGAAANGCLVAGERRREQRARIEPAALDGRSDVLGGFSRPALGELAAQVPKRVGQDGNWQRNRLAGKGRYAARKFGGEIFRGKREARKARALDGLLELDDPCQQSALEIDRRGEIGPGDEDRVPAHLGGGRKLSGRGRRKLNVGHVADA